MRLVRLFLLASSTWSLTGMKRTLTAIAGALLFSAFVSCYANEGGWDFETYHIQLKIAVDAPGGYADQLSSELPAYYQNRIEASLLPQWAVDVTLATGADRANVLTELASATDLETPKLPDDKDKLILAVIRWSPNRVELIAREFVKFVQRWGPPIRRESCQAEAVPEQLFALICQAFSPLAQFEPDPKDPKRVLLKLRGASLPRSIGAPPLVKPGDLFLPILRRTGRGGQLEKNGLQVVPWTYVEASEIQKDVVIGKLQSASRKPFPTRRQGRTDQIAIALRGDPSTTTLRFRARNATTKPLAGYDVFSEKPGTGALSRIGLTDSLGEIKVEPGKDRLQFLLVKHGGLPMARLPVVSGASPRIDVSLPDDDARLAAETRLAAVREDLIDVVARRNILMARARAKIQKKDFVAAQELVRALDDLPNRPQFDISVRTAEQSSTSGDLQMQRRIKQMFDTTRKLLTQYLDLRPINQLKKELPQAQSKPASPPTGRNTSRGRAKS